MFGGNDAQAIRSGKDWLKVGSEGWREIYGQRVEAFIKKLRAANIAVYWVGLPIMRSPGQSSDAEAMNEVFREKAFINGAKFIDTWNGFTDEAGRYSAYGPDMTGQVKRLRADDGVHFTMRGYLKLAHFVEKELRRDLNLAKIERNIPLAGNEDEQAKVMGRDVVPGRSEPGASRTHARPARCRSQSQIPSRGSSEQAQGEQTRRAGTRRAGAGDQPPQLQESSVGDVSLVRPAIDQTLQAAQGLTPQGSRRGDARGRDDHERAQQRLDRRRHHLLGHRPVARLFAAAAAALAAALLQGSHQGRAAQAQGRQGRRLRLAARLSRR